MSRKLPVLFVVCIAVFASLVALGPSPRHNSPASSLRSAAQGTNLEAARTRLLSSYGRLPLTFERNLGQSDSLVQFLAHGDGYALFLTGQEAVLRLDVLIGKESQVTTPPAPGPAKTSQRAQKSSSVVRLALAGSNQHSLVEGLDLQPGRSNYFIGNDPAKWRRGVPQYARVKYRGIYPGIDLIFYGNQGQLESDYVLAPGADPKQIALRVEGAENLKLDAETGLTLLTKSGDVILQRPIAYQEADGRRQEIAANYIQRAPSIVGIELGPYNSSQPLIIDPVLIYSTYLGGKGADHANAIAVDSSGNAYVTGSTTSSDFPLKGAFQTTLNSTTRGNAFVTELNPTGTSLVFSTFLGGTATNGLGENGDIGEGIAVDSLGNVYVAGSTGSKDFPTSTITTPFQITNNGTTTSAFLTKLDPTGSQLLYSTYIGGNGGEFCHALAVDANGNAYLTGITSSTTYPVTPATAIQTANTSGESVFVSRFDPTQPGTLSLIYSTLLGGSTTGIDMGLGIAVDSSANAYVTGSTTSSTFPVTTTTTSTTAAGFQTSMKGTAGNAFLAQIDTTTANHLVYSSFLGGTATTSPGDSGTGVALDPGFNAFVVGTVESTDFPTTAGVFQSKTKNTALSAFVARFDTTKSGAQSLVYSTILGGSTDEFGNGIAVDSLGDAFVTGETASKDFPVTLGAPQSALAGGSNAFLSQFNPTGTALLFSTYHGGNGLDGGLGIALDTGSAPNAYIAGFTTSNANFPITPGAFQTTFNSTAPAPESAFVAKFSPAAAAGVFVNPSAIPFGTVNLGSPSSPQAVTLINNTKTMLSGIKITFTGTNASDFTQKSTTCATTLAATSTCIINVVFTPTKSVAESATLNIAFTGASGSPQTVALSGTGSGSAQPDFSLSVTPSPLSVTAGAIGNFTVTVTSINSFSAAVALTCTGVPLNSACTLLPTSVTPPSGSTKTSAGAITTHALIPPSLPSFPRLRPVGVLGIFGLLLAFLMARAAARRGARKLAWGFALIGALALAGCSGVPQTGGGGSGSTPKGTSTITITGTSASLTHTTTFSFTVN
jgi:beta-propeller repeat-containing protein/centrosomal CEP192-like protein